MFWLATRPAYIGLYSKAGRSHVFEPIGTWWHTQPEDTCGGWMRVSETAIKADWHPL